MAKQLKLQTKEFVKLVDCTMTGEQYLALLAEKKGTLSRLGMVYPSWFTSHDVTFVTLG